MGSSRAKCMQRGPAPRSGYHVSRVPSAFSGVVRGRRHSTLYPSQGLLGAPHSPRLPTCCKMSLDRLPRSPHRGETAVTAIFVYDYHVTGARASVCPPGSLTRGWLDLFSSLVMISLPLLALLEITPAGVNLRRRDKMPAEMTSTRKLTVAMGLTLLTCSQGIMMAVR